MRGVVARCRGRVILTPNRSEAEDLACSSALDVPDLEVAHDLAERFGAVAAVHGAIAAADDRSWVERHGSVGLATSGSGDVLAGLVAGAAARGHDPAQAACWGCHVHATAGDRLADRLGWVGSLARELIDEAPLVLAALDC